MSEPGANRIISRTDSAHHSCDTAELYPGTRPDSGKIYTGRRTHYSGKRLRLSGKSFCRSGYRLQTGHCRGRGDGIRLLDELKSILPPEKIVFTGYVYGEKLNQLYTHAGLYVLSSYNEGFPLVLLEAMSYGLDVLVSDIPASHLVDLPADDYFSKGDYEELARKNRAETQIPPGNKNMSWKHTIGRPLLKGLPPYMIN